MRTTHSTFCYYDAGDGLRGDKGDCQVRALVKARDIGYWSAWRLLYDMQGESQRCSFGLLVGLKANDERLGVIRYLSFPSSRGHKRMTTQDFCKKHPTGRYIVRMAHHVAAVVDGVLYDCWDSSQKCVYGAYEVSKDDSGK